MIKRTIKKDISKKIRISFIFLKLNFFLFFATMMRMNKDSKKFRIFWVIIVVLIVISMVVSLIGPAIF